MRSYAKLAPTFWTGATGREIRRKGPEAVIVALYLMSAPGSTMLGLYYQPIHHMAHETGLGLERAQKGLEDCISVGFCHYDESTETVWVVEMAAYQIAKELRPSDNRCAGIQRDYDSLPDNPFLDDFFDRYQHAFHLSGRRGSKGASKGLPSQEQEQELEQAHGQEHENASSLRSDLGEVMVEGVFEGRIGRVGGEGIPSRIAPATTSTAQAATALRRAGISATSMNPDLIAFIEEGGATEHLLELATAYPNKPVKYLITAARRELADKAASVTGTTTTRCAPSKQRAAIERLRRGLIEPSRQDTAICSPLPADEEPIYGNQDSFRQLAHEGDPQLPTSSSASRRGVIV